jgi:hypothetical protein
MDNMILGDGVSALDRKDRTSTLLFRARAFAARESPSLATTLDQIETQILMNMKILLFLFVSTSL